MATNRKPTVVGSRIADVVASAKRVAQSERSARQAKMEADFQRAIADGLSYEEQVKFRQKQVLQEQSAPFSDADYIAKLETSVSNTKRLARFNRYRTTYRNSLGELNAGRITAIQQLDRLQAMLEGVTDPDLREEIIADISAAQTQVKSYQDTVLANRVKKAQYDGTEEVLRTALSDVRAARLDAQLFGREDELEVHDQTIASLTGQLSTVRIADSIDDFRVEAATRGHSVEGKLGFLDSKLAAADATTPVRIDDKNYGSEREFWQLQRDSYLRGSSELFGNFINELKTEVAEGLASDKQRFGNPTQTSLDTAKAKFDIFTTKTGLEPFGASIIAARNEILGTAADQLAAAVVDRATASLDFKGADATLKNIETRYGVNVDAQRLKLESNLLSIPDSAIPRSEKLKLLPDNKDIVPDRVEKFEKPPKLGADVTVASKPDAPAGVDAGPATPAAYGGGSIVDYLRSTGGASDFVSRKSLAEKYGIQNYVGNADQNTELLSALRSGVKPPEPTPAPPAASEPAPVIEPAPTLEQVPKKMATLVNRSTGDRKAVEVDSQDAKTLFGQGYELET